MTFEQDNKTRVVLHRAALEAVYDECDRYDADETGGRLVGTYEQGGGLHTITVKGVIEPGPNATRTATSFFQDGNYQADVFRHLEHQLPEIEHLGNWHTHHVNGYPTLSGGDIKTYQRIVNHQLHNTNFFYALLIVAKNGDSSPNRYTIKHYILHKDDSKVKEIASNRVRIVDRPIVWPLPAPVEVGTDFAGSQENQVRTKDQEVLGEQYPSIKPYLSKNKRMFWKGKLELVDESQVSIVVAETKKANIATYTLAAKGKHASLLEGTANREYPSARTAIWDFERQLNKIIYRSAANSAGKKRGED